MIRALDLAAGQRSAVEETAHRPWPLPGGGWLMGQTWEHLLFAHWPVAAEALRPVVPPELDIDEHSGSAWLGLTPFRIGGLRLRGTLPAPVASTFAELNIRTYVTVAGKPGIWFLSLETPSRLAIAAARRFYRLPYRRARVQVSRRGERYDYAAERGGRTTLRASITPRGAPRQPEPGSLEHFLVERYCLYTVYRSALHRADIHHRPWSIQAAAGEVEPGEPPPGAPRPTGEPLLHFAPRQDALIWPLERL